VYRSLDGAHGQQFKDRLGRHEGLGAGSVEGYSSLAEQTSIRSFFWQPGVATVCETGFNAGHSAANYLLANAFGLPVGGPGHIVRYVGFDLGRTQYSKTGERLLKTLFPVRFRFAYHHIIIYDNHRYALLGSGARCFAIQGKVEVHWGDSTDTLPQYMDAHPELVCDGIMVDGGHDFQTSRSDLRQFLRRARCGSHVAIDDIEMPELQRTWREAQEQVSERFALHVHL
jgi:hypothetical protein